MKKSTVGAYGGWLARLAEKPGPLSFLNRRLHSPADWRSAVRPRVIARLNPPDAGGTPRVRVIEKYEWEGLHIERLEWRLPYGPPTSALFLKPAGYAERLPAVLALHCHGGNKYLGWEKIARGRRPPTRMLRWHVNHYYGGVFWANELARRGYAVLAPDAYAFASRRVRTADVLDRVRGGAPSADPVTERDIRRYNDWAAGHANVMAKALFAAGTTWPGVVLAEDRKALDVLCARPDVDRERVGCGGLSGGGLRTVYLAGLDYRVKCAVCVGYMTTWRDMAVNQCWTNTWMVNTAILPGEMDFPEILGMRAPLPTLVMNDKKDQLYNLGEMRRADRILGGIYRKARASDRYRCSYYPGFHKFDLPMQSEAFDWYDRWLK